MILFNKVELIGGKTSQTTAIGSKLRVGSEFTAVFYFMHAKNSVAGVLYISNRGGNRKQLVVVEVGL